MNEKMFNTRIIHKHDTEANWNKAVNFIPMQGEIIVYDIDENYNYERIKIGDGQTVVADLSFTISAEVTPEDIIEWMTEEGAIVPLASTSGQVYATNDNKILII